jgi:hypothetical protein
MSFAKVILKSITNLLKIVTTIVTRDMHKVIKKNTHQSRQIIIGHVVAEFEDNLSSQTLLYNTVRSKKKLELAVTKNFSWQFVKISIIRCLKS